jgi:hypothetical protein
MKQEHSISSSEPLACYERLVATIPALERKGATMPYTSLNGHMFSYLDKDGALALRLPKEAREEFLAKYQAHLHESYGIVQKEYVTVPEELLQNTVELQPYFQISYEYIQTLKPKPSKKGSSAKS